MAEVLLIHDRLIREYGGEPGSRHVGAVEAALARMEEGPFETGDLAERAALVFRGIIEDHPFVDGNKRSGFAVADVFLKMNGFALSPPEPELIEFAFLVARGLKSLGDIAEWMRTHMRRL